MGFSPKSAAELKQLILTSFASYLRLVKAEVDARPGSHLDAFAEAVALLAESQEVKAVYLVKQLFPDTADDAYVLAHARVLGIGLKPASTARIPVQVSGPPLTTVSVGAVTLRWIDGSAYLPVEPDGVDDLPITTIAFSAEGLATIHARAKTAGTAGNRLPGDRLTWSSAPTGVAAMATVLASDASTIAATDSESIDQLGERVLRLWRERPGGGNRADHRSWAENGEWKYVTSIAQSFPYPITRTTTTGGATPTPRPFPDDEEGPHVLGATTNVLLGPPGAGRIPSTAVVDDFLAFLHGTGEYSRTGGKVPSDCFRTDFNAMAPLLQSVNLVLEVTPTPGFGAPFTGAYTVAAGSTATVVKLTSDPRTVGPGQVRQGASVAVALPSVVGGYAFGRVVGVASDSITLDRISVLGADNKMTQLGELPSVPAAGAQVRPAMPSWFASDGILERIAAIFDRLGPGDWTDEQDPSGESRRWPTEDEEGPASVFPSTIVAAVQGFGAVNAQGLPANGVPGVRGLSVVSPSAAVTPPALTVLRIGVLTVNQA